MVTFSIWLIYGANPLIADHYYAWHLLNLFACFQDQ